MKHILPAVMFFILLLSLAACGGSPIPVQPSQTASPVLLKEAAGSPTPVINTTAPESTSTQTPGEVAADTAVSAASEVVSTAAEAAAAEVTETVTANPAETAGPTSEPTSVLPDAQIVPVTASSERDLQPASDCEDKAAFFEDVTVPDDTSFKHSVDFEKVWRLRNEGSCTWDGYNLVWAGGSVFDAPLFNPIPMTEPGELVDIPVTMRAPNQGGLFTSYWELENAAGKRFGVNSGGVDLIWVRISVSWYPEGETLPAASTLPAPADECSPVQNTAYIEQIRSLVNNTRAQNHLPAFTFDPRLDTAAYAHSADMACKDFIDHVGSDGSSWQQRIQASGYRFAHASENIYVGDPAFGGDAAGAFNWWMNSEIHRNNILSSKSTQIGIGYAFNPASTYKGYFTLNFARP